MRIGSIFKGERQMEIFQVFAENWFSSFTPKEFADRFGFNYDTVKRALPELEKARLLQKEKDAYCVSKTRLCRNFKMFYDLYKILNHLPENKRELILDIYNLAEPFVSSCVVFGSTASLSHTEKSDIDILLIAKSENMDEMKKNVQTRRILGANANTIFLGEEQFERDYLDADDFVISTLSSNLVVYDDGFFGIYLGRGLPEPSEKAMAKKREQLQITKNKLDDAMEIGDLEAAYSQMMDYLLNSARIKLWQSGTVPTDKTNIIEKIKTIDENLYGLIMQLLKNPKKSVKRIYEGLGKSKRAV